MPAYSRGELSIEAYLVRVIAALCKQNGGELRVKGELVDMVGESTVLLKAWDSTKQELVLTVTPGTFGEVFRVVAEKQTPKPIATTQPDPMASFFRENPGNGKSEEFLPKSSTIDNPRLAEMERARNVAKAAALIKDELRRRKEARAD